jgi:hypothetical protein
MPPLRRTGPSSSAPPPFAPPYFSRQKSLMIDPYLASSRQALEAAVLNPSINVFLFALHVFAFVKIVSSNLLFHRSPVAPGGSCRQRAFISTKHQQPRHVATPRFLTVLLNIGNAKSCIREFISSWRIQVLKDLRLPSFLRINFDIRHPEPRRPYN